MVIKYVTLNMTGHRSSPPPKKPVILIPQLREKNL